jgi:hypothetical protein
MGGGGAGKLFQLADQIVGEKLIRQRRRLYSVATTEANREPRQRREPNLTAKAQSSDPP